MSSIITHGGKALLSPSGKTINFDALIDQANETTGASDVTLTDAVQTLCDGYGQGGGTGRLIFSDYDSEGLPQTMEYVPASPQDTKLPDRFCSYGHQYTLVTWFSKINNIICPNHITELGIGGFGVGTLAKHLSNYDYIVKLGNSAMSGQIFNIDRDYFPPNLEYVGSSGFEREPLSDASATQLPQTLKYIGDYAFQFYSINNKSVKWLLPNVLEYIGRSAFYNNGFQLFSETELVIPSSVSFIGNKAFGGAAFRTPTVKFLGTPETIEASAFESSTSNGSMKALTDIYVPWAEGEIANAPWGATNATIHYNYTSEV